MWKAGSKRPLPLGQDVSGTRLCGSAEVPVEDSRERPPTRQNDLTERAGAPSQGDEIVVLRVAADGLDWLLLNDRRCLKSPAKTAQRRGVEPRSKPGTCQDVVQLGQERR